MVSFLKGVVFVDFQTLYSSIWGLVSWKHYAIWRQLEFFFSKIYWFSDLCPGFNNNLRCRRINERGKSPCIKEPLPCTRLGSKGSLIHGVFPIHWPDGYAMLMSPNKGETAVHGCHCLGDMAVRMRVVQARPWVGVCVPLALILSSASYADKFEILQHTFKNRL